MDYFTLEIRHKKRQKIRETKIFSENKKLFQSEIEEEEKEERREKERERDKSNF